MSLWVTIASASLVAGAVLLVGYPLVVEPAEPGDGESYDEELCRVEQEIAREIHARREGRKG